MTQNQTIDHKNVRIFCTNKNVTQKKRLTSVEMTLLSITISIPIQMSAFPSFDHTNKLFRCHYFKQKGIFNKDKKCFNLLKKTTCYLISIVKMILNYVGLVGNVCESVVRLIKQKGLLNSIVNQ